MEVSAGAGRGLAQIARLLADEHSAIPALLRTPVRLALDEIRLMEGRIDALKRALAALARNSAACQVLATVPGIGLLTSTAMVAAIGDPKSFDSARRYASFFGLTPREYSSGDQPIPALTYLWRPSSFAGGAHIRC